MTKLRDADSERRAESDYSPDFSEALARGLRIITAFSADRRQMTLSDIARAVDLPRATARRALYTLTYLGYVETEGKLYRLRPNILGLATAYLVSNPVSTILQPVCEEIADDKDMTSSVAVLEKGEAVLICRGTPKRPMSAGLGLGYRVPAYCSSLGRVLLAELSDSELDTYLAELKPEALTPITITKPAEIRDAILKVRADGHAFVDQETEPGFRSIAVPLRRFDGKVIAALNLGAQSESMPADFAIDTLVPFLKARAAELQSQLH